MFIFDNVPSHLKLPDGTLNAKVMNVGLGGKQPAMKDTTWNGSIQTMTLPDGDADGTRRARNLHQWLNSRKNATRVKNFR